jgi:hypothetical protein
MMELNCRLMSERGHEAALGSPAGWIPSTDNMGFAAGELSFSNCRWFVCACGIISVLMYAMQYLSYWLVHSRQLGSPAGWIPSTNSMGSQQLGCHPAMADALCVTVLLQLAALCDSMGFAVGEAAPLLFCSDVSHVNLQWFTVASWGHRQAGLPALTTWALQQVGEQCGTVNFTPSHNLMVAEGGDQCIFTLSF